MSKLRSLVELWAVYGTSLLIPILRPPYLRWRPRQRCAEGWSSFPAWATSGGPHPSGCSFFCLLTMTSNIDNPEICSKFFLINLSHIDVYPMADEIFHTKAALIRRQVVPAVIEILFRYRTYRRSGQDPRHGVVTQPRFCFHHGNITAVI